MIKRVVDVKPGDVVVDLIAPGESTVEKVQYEKDNVRVRLTSTLGSSIVLPQFQEVEVVDAKQEERGQMRHTLSVSFKRPRQEGTLQ